MSVMLGTRIQPRDYSATGLAVDMRDSRHILGRNWMEWWLIREQQEWVGQVRERPSRMRLWLERHGLAVAGAAVGLMVLELVAAVAWIIFVR